MYEKLIASAIEAREGAYASYSHFKVGAALLCADGTVFLGCNVENASYSVTCCAERVALFNAVSRGYRDFVAVAVVGATDGKELDFCPPCGVCRQAFVEFCDASFVVITAKSPTEYKETTLGELLPSNFGRENL